MQLYDGAATADRLADLVRARPPCGALAIVNRGSTPWDARAELVLDAGAGETLRLLAALLPEAR